MTMLPLIACGLFCSILQGPNPDNEAPQRCRGKRALILLPSSTSSKSFLPPKPR